MVYVVLGKIKLTIVSSEFDLFIFNSLFYNSYTIQTEKLKLQCHSSFYKLINE